MRRDVFQAVADPTRRKIIQLIAAEAMTPNALAARFPSSRQAVSKHIRVLKDCGLIATKRSGRERYYHIKPRKLKELDDWIEPFRQLWASRFHQLDQLLNNMGSQSQ